MVIFIRKGDKGITRYAICFCGYRLGEGCFLHASDIVSHTECVDENEKKQFLVKDISELVREGQDIVVQVVKDPIGTKGARLTTDITLPSRYLVFMPENSHVGVSQRIESEEERARLKAWLSLIVMNLGALLYVPLQKRQLKKV